MHRDFQRRITEQVRHRAHNGDVDGRFRHHRSAFCNLLHPVVESEHTRKIGCPDGVAHLGFGLNDIRRDTARIEIGIVKTAIRRDVFT